MSVFIFVLIGLLIVYQSWFAIAELTHVSLVAEVPMNIMHGIIPASFVFIIACILIRLRDYLAGTLESETDQVEALREAAAASERAAKLSGKS